ncbi:chitin deacetylase [Mesoplasma syrphidae]|uniref:Chitin deacetylase n=1 Tax=Mesoplasma syrphidae TaxID=225999 RepID=A0A2K9CC92_9MOLU|nr:polysaccharide deacetylase family protein [Mesoplasma syrphidae]AUF83254.1 chitin deacetylase [Mesoplasma syrphidae]
MKTRITKIIATCFLFVSVITCIFNIATIKQGYEVNRIKTDQRVVMLTFDDGPTTDDLDILNILKSENIHATFFMTGVNLAKYKTDQNVKVVVDRIIKEGHTIGNHTYNHNEYIHNEKKLIEEIQKTNQLIENAYVENNVSILKKEIPVRLSYLQYFKGIDFVEKQVGIKYLVRGYLGTDYNEEITGKNKIINQYMSHLSPGKIFVCHTRSYAKVWLPKLITNLKEKSYSFAAFRDDAGQMDSYKKYGKLVF